ncbi:cilia- and flagella-associated protein HOATZ [Clinocottus analis]|uniref:cilia- and flagella-associated protein HOATZ n=1 Tax=Clinocottus analis TaxID=304258 RepID=UPI0035C03209
MSFPEPNKLDALFTVFEGSSPENASHARLLWSSLSLLPPLESRLVSADIRQRLPVSRPLPRGCCSSGAGPKQSTPPQSTQSLEPALPQRLEERRRYAALADQRRETMALLRRQREQRLRREGLLSGDFKPKLKPKPGGEKTSRLEKPADSELDAELVKQLQ